MMNRMMKTVAALCAALLMLTSLPFAALAEEGAAAEPVAEAAPVVEPVAEPTPAPAADQPAAEPEAPAQETAAPEDAQVAEIEAVTETAQIEAQLAAVSAKDESASEAVSEDPEGEPVNGEAAEKAEEAAAVSESAQKPASPAEKPSATSAADYPQISVGGTVNGSLSSAGDSMTVKLVLKGSRSLTADFAGAKVTMTIRRTEDGKDVLELSETGDFRLSAGEYLLVFTSAGETGSFSVKISKQQKEEPPADVESNQLPDSAQTEQNEGEADEIAVDDAEAMTGEIEAADASAEGETVEEPAESEEAAEEVIEDDIAEGGEELTEEAITDEEPAEGGEDLADDDFAEGEEEPTEDELTETEDAESTFTVSVLITSTKQYYYVGDTVTFGAFIEGEIAEPVYQWQCFNGSEWVDIEGAVGDSLSIVLTEENSGSNYRVIVTDNAPADITPVTEG